MNLKKAYSQLFPIYEKELESVVYGCKTLLDVGCGSNSPIRYFSKKIYSVGVDIYKPSIELSKKKRIHNKYQNLDILDIGKKFKPNSFDCVLASDVIEHLTKKDGEKLIKAIEQIAGKKVIIFTPNGFINQDEYDKNPWQMHKSGWEVKEMKQKGYRVYGIHGLKTLRGDHSVIKYKPRKFWLFVSNVTQKVVKYIPEYAFALLCVKNLEPGTV